VSDYDGNILFKEWLPDLAELNNPGLTEAINAIPSEGVYRSYAPLGASIPASTLNARAQGALVQLIPPASVVTFAGTSNKLYVSGTDKSAATYNTASAGFWRFDVFNDQIIATNGADLPQYRAVSTTGSFATLGSASGTAPSAVHVAALGQFVMLGNLPAAQTHFVRWSGIDNHLSWPTPNSATAVAQQSGEQELSFHRGAVTGISGGDQHGLIYQENGITRVTYVGGSVVFQFDVIDPARGNAFPNGFLKVGGLDYFASADGFFVTDGVTVKPIGDGRINRYFASTCDFSFRQRVYAAHDARNRCVVWAYPTTAATSGRPNRLLIYSYAEDRWSRAEDETESLTTHGSLLNTFSSAMIAFKTDLSWAYFNGTPGTSILTTGEMEPNPGGLASYQGIRPLVDATVNAVTIAMGTRNDRTSAVSYTSETTANSRTGLCNFRNEARYHRARMTVAGTFNAAQGLEYSAEASGYT
jgi:hypothetical protein